MQITDTVIVLSRINYGEKDRIITLLGREHGKFRVLARSVRGPKSKLAGGVEPLSISQVTFVKGKSGAYILTGTRLEQHFNGLSRDVTVMNQSFEMVKTVNKLSEDGEGEEFYEILSAGLEALNDPSYDPALVQTWFNIRILDTSGRLGAFIDDARGDLYRFDYEKQCFIVSDQGDFTENDIKALMLCQRGRRPIKITSFDAHKVAKLSGLLLKTSLVEV